MRPQRGEGDELLALVKAQTKSNQIGKIYQTSYTSHKTHADRGKGNNEDWSTPQKTYLEEQLFKVPASTRSFIPRK